MKSHSAYTYNRFTSISMWKSPVVWLWLFTICTYNNSMVNGKATDGSGIYRS